MKFFRPHKPRASLSSNDWVE